VISFDDLYERSQTAHVERKPVRITPEEHRELLDLHPGNRTAANPVVFGVPFVIGDDG
jgi:hypothetical protein